MSVLLWVLAFLSTLLGAVVIAEAESVLHEILAFAAFIDAAILLVGAVLADTVKEQAGRIVGRLDRLLGANEAPPDSATATPVREPVADADAEEWMRFKCPGCRKRLHREAETCEHCGREILPLMASPAELSADKICAGCGKRVSWNDPVTWRDGIRYHTPCAPSA